MLHLSFKKKINSCLWTKKKVIIMNTNKTIKEIEKSQILKVKIIKNESKTEYKKI